MKLKHLLIILMTAIVAPLQLMARDFTYNGIIYTVIDEEAKTCETKAGNKFSGNSVSGELILPAHPMDGETEFTLTRIGDSAFASNSNLISAVIPETVTYIGQLAFRNTSLKTITIPANVKSIGSYAFDNTKLETIYYNAVECTSIARSWFPNTVNRLIFHRRVKIIPDRAFDGLSKLTEITLPDRLETIGESAFEDCYSISEIEIPASVKSIGKFAFKGCKLNSLKFNAVKCTVCVSAFPASLTDLTIGDGVESIPPYAFSGCGLKGNLTMPSSLKSIGSYAFKCPAGISNVEIGDANRWCGVTFGNSFANPIAVAGSFSVEGEVVKKLDLAPADGNVSSYAFYGAKNLETVRVKGTKIGSNSFENCSSLKQVCVDVETMSELCFGACNAIESVWSRTATPPVAADNAFSNYSNATLYVPVGSRTAYDDTDDCWWHFSKIVESDFANIDDIFKSDLSGIDEIATGNEVSISLNGRTLSVIGADNLATAIYNQQGCMVYAAKGCADIELNQGLYIVKAGNKTSKVLVR